MPSTITDRLNGLTTSVAVKAPCRAGTTANITLFGVQTIDGVAVVAGDRVLVKDQTITTENGIYEAGASTWARAADFDGSLDVVGGTWVKVNSGSTNADSYWEVAGDGAKTPGTDSITFTPTSGNLTLQADLASTVVGKGAAMVGYKRPKSWASAKTVLDHILDTAVSITELGGVQDFDFDTNTGSDCSTVALDNCLADPDVHAVFIPPGEKGFKFTRSIRLPADTSIQGTPTPKTHSSSKNAPMSKIAYRPVGADKVAIEAIENAVAEWGQGVSDLAIDCNNFDHNGIQFYFSYSNAAKNISLFGDFNVGILCDTTYVNTIDGVYSSGLARFKNAVVVIGENNGTTIKNFHSGSEPANAADLVFGILAQGNNHSLLIEQPVCQGMTIGIHLGAGISSATITNPYFENVVTPIRLGSHASLAGPEGVNIIGGTFGGPYPSHPQYLSRGPIIYLRGSNGLVMGGWRCSFQPEVANVKGPWFIVAGQAAGRSVINPGSVYNDPAVANNGQPDDYLMLEDVTYSPSYLINAFDVSNYGEAQTFQKVGGAYAGVGRKISMDNAGTWVTAAYTPTVIPAVVSALIKTEAPTTVSLRR